MIFLTVGTQLSFDRLVSIVDDWACRNPEAEVFGQLGPSNYVPKAIACKKFINPEEFNSLIRRASLIVAHAGIGTILTALQYKIPLIIMPRKHELGEHRNDHQMATAKRFSDVKGVHIAKDKTHLLHLLDQTEPLEVPTGIAEFADENMIYSLRDAIHL